MTSYCLSYPYRRRIKENSIMEHRIIYRPFNSIRILYYQHSKIFRSFFIYIIRYSLKIILLSLLDWPRNLSFSIPWAVSIDIGWFQASNWTFWIYSWKLPHSIWYSIPSTFDGLAKQIETEFFIQWYKTRVILIDQKCGYLTNCLALLKLAESRCSHDDYAELQTLYQDLSLLYRIVYARRLFPVILDRYINHGKSTLFVSEWIQKSLFEKIEYILGPCILPLNNSVTCVDDPQTFESIYINKMKGIIGVSITPQQILVNILFSLWQYRTTSAIPTRMKMELLIWAFFFPCTPTPWKILNRWTHYQTWRCWFFINIYMNTYSILNRLMIMKVQTNCCTTFWQILLFLNRKTQMNMYISL